MFKFSSLVSDVGVLEDLGGGVGEPSITGTADGSGLEGSGLEGTLHTDCLSERASSARGDRSGRQSTAFWRRLAGFALILTSVSGEPDPAVLSFGYEPSRIHRLRCPRRDPMLRYPNFFSHRETLFFQEVPLSSCFVMKGKNAAFSNSSHFLVATIVC